MIVVSVNGYGKMSDEIKTKILSIIQEKPNHYTRIIKKDIELYDWVMSNSIISKDLSFSEHIYSSLYNKTNICEHNNIKKYKNIKDGFGFCGIAKFCKCCKESVSESVSSSFLQKSKEEISIISHKRKTTNIEKYGVDNIGKIDIAKENHKKLYNDKKIVSQIQDKIKNTNIERYGVENPMQYKDIANKVKETNIQKYGVECTLNAPEIVEKTRNTLLERYGVENIFQSDQIKEKIKKNNLIKYGTEYPMQVSEVRDKMKQTHIERYGVEHNKHFHITQDALNILNDKNSFCEFIKEKPVYEITKELGVEKTLIYKKIIEYDAQDLYQKRGLTYLESEMKEFLDNNNISYEINNRTILGGKELDFYIQDYNIAIEMNGLYYHTDTIRPDHQYHYKKWKICNDKNIHLVNIFEDDWNLQQDKVCNMLLGFFGKKIKGIPARKTYIQKINGRTARPFLDQYHLQGYVSGTHYGAFDVDNNLIGIMTFGTTRNGRFELKRFVTDEYIHNGLFSKLFKYAQSDLDFSEVVSFSDNTHFTGNVYKINGFNFIQVIKPDYRYLVNKTRVHKSNYTKQKIKSKFPELSESIDNGMTESSAMEYLGFSRIYDCGKCEWIWKNV
jgi:hypothetical protein